jgi:hypothetical protein
MRRQLIATHSAKLHLNARRTAQEMKTMYKRNDMMEEEKRKKKKKKKTCKSLRQRSEKTRKKN